MKQSFHHSSHDKRPRFTGRPRSTGRYHARHLAALTLMLSLLLHTPTSASTKIDATLSSPAVLVNETATLSVTVTGEAPLGWLDIPQAPPLIIKRHKHEPLPASDQVRYTYHITSSKPGNFNIPVFSFNQAFSRAQILRVDSLERLKTHITSLHGSPITWHSSTIQPRVYPWLGESVPLLFKLYLPAEFEVLDPGYPDFQKSNLSTKIFQPVQSIGKFTYQNRPYHAFTFHTTYHLIENKAATLGPGKIQPLLNLRTNRGGLTSWEKTPLPLSLPPLTLLARPLPLPIPRNFSGAIGHFTLKTTCPEPTATLNGPLPIVHTLTGKGNHTVAPIPSETEQGKQSEQWEFTPASKNQKLTTDTTTVFNQTLRPLDLHTTIPTFSLTYFDPILGKYRTTKSHPLAITVTPPIKDTAQGLHTLIPENTSISFKPALSPWLWHLIPAITCLFLALPLLRRKKSNLAQNSDWETDYQKLEKLTHSPAPEFLRQLGYFLHNHPIKDPSLKNEIIQQRDLHCFSPNPQKTPLQNAPQLLQRLKKSLPLLPLLLTFFILFPQPAPASITPQPAPDYLQLRTQLLNEKSPTPTQLYNLAVCEYHLHRPGHAARYYRKITDTLPQTAKNLQALEEETQAILPRQKKPAEWMTLLTRQTWTHLLLLALWLIPITILIYLRSPIRKIPLTFSLTTLLILISLLYIRATYPRDISFLPRHDLTTIVNPTSLHTAPVASSATSKKIPPASLIKVHKTNDHWTYIELPHQITGWIPSASLR